MYPALEPNAGAKQTCRYEPHKDIEDLGRHRWSPNVVWSLSYKTNMDQNDLYKGHPLICFVPVPDIEHRAPGLVHCCSGFALRRRKS